MTENRTTLVERLREPDRYGQSYDDKCEAANKIESLRAALVEARQWLGDGCNADGLHRDLWTPAYRAVIDKIDSVLGSKAVGADEHTGNCDSPTCPQCVAKGYT